MSDKKLKIPSSARRHIKIDQFSQFISASRLRNVQDVLTKMTTDGTSMDGILLIAGIDSRYNEGCLELLNYLLFGFFTARKEELESSGFAEEDIDDLMILICKDQVSVYCNPVNYHYLLPYLSHWPAIQFHCLTEDEYDGENDDASEEFKIQSLIAMVSRCNILGIPYYGKGTGGGKDFNVMLLEKWPIIQAYALDEFGGRGFFTMNFDVRDVSNDTSLLPNYQDSVSVEILLMEHLPLLSRQWSNMMQCVQMYMNDSINPVLSGKNISEPLQSYFNHGLVGHKGRVGRVPFVVFNHETSLAEFYKLQTTTEMSDSKVHIDSDNLHTMICQVVSPHSPVICARTYFLTKEPFALSPTAKNNTNQEQSFLELRYCSDIYMAMVHAVLTGIESYAHSSSVTKAHHNCIEDLKSCCGQMSRNLLDSYWSNNSNFEFVLDNIGNDNRGIPLVEGNYSPIMKYISLTLYKVPPPKGSKMTPKTMVFAETFLDSRIFVKGCPDVSSDFLILTSGVPRFYLWSACGQGQKWSVQAPRLPVDVWGAALMTQSDIDMTSTWSALLPPEKVNITLWKHGLSVESRSYGSFSIHGNQMESVSLYDGNSMTQVALLSIQVNSQDKVSSDHLPPHVLVDVDNAGMSQILFAFNPHSKAHTQLYGNVLPVWKEDSQLPSVQRPEDLEPDHVPIHAYMQNKLESIANSSNGSLKQISAGIPDLFGFLEHLCESSSIHQPVTPEVYQTLTAPHEARNNGNKIVVTIITGAPGSEKERLATLLTTYNSIYVKWLVYKQPEECRVNASFLHQSMTSAAQSTQQLTKSARMILIAPGFCDVASVLGVMQSHPDPNVRSQFVIGAVTVCIDPLNAFIDHKTILPMLTSHCAQGWVNNIVFTSQTQAPSEVLDRLQTLIRSVNSNVALLKAENGEVKRSTDLDNILSETAFEESVFQRARVLIKPMNESGVFQPWPCNPDMNEVILKFTHPLEKHLTLIKLRSIKQSLKRHPFDGNIYFVRGYLRFSGSATLIDIQFTPMSGRLSMVDSKSAPGTGEGSVYIVAFTGVRLREVELKTFLGTCVKQKPQKKTFLMRTELTQKDIDKIHSEHHLDVLPEGWFYNGSQFVSMAGERSHKHPGLDGFIQEFLDKKNMEIEKFNSHIETDSYINLFP